MYIANSSTIGNGYILLFPNMAGEKKLFYTVSILLQLILVENFLKKYATQLLK